MNRRGKDTGEVDTDGSLKKGNQKPEHYELLFLRPMMLPKFLRYLCMLLSLNRERLMLFSEEMGGNSRNSNKLTRICKYNIISL